MASRKIKLLLAGLALSLMMTTGVQAAQEQENTTQPVIQEETAVEDTEEETDLSKGGQDTTGSPKSRRISVRSRQISRKQKGKIYQHRRNRKPAPRLQAWQQDGTNWKEAFSTAQLMKGERSVPSPAGRISTERPFTSTATAIWRQTGC